MDEDQGGSGVTLIVREFVALGLFAFLSSAFAHDPEGKHSEWMGKQHNRANGLCCSGEDAKYLDEEEWGMRGDHYWVKIEGRIIWLEDWQNLRPDGGANPSGRALVWYAIVPSQTGGTPSIVVRCFTPEYET